MLPPLIMDNDFNDTSSAFKNNVLQCVLTVPKKKSIIIPLSSLKRCHGLAMRLYGREHIPSPNFFTKKRDNNCPSIFTMTFAACDPQVAIHDIINKSVSVVNMPTSAFAIF